VDGHGEETATTPARHRDVKRAELISDPGLKPTPPGSQNRRKVHFPSVASVWEHAVPVSQSKVV